MGLRNRTGLLVLVLLIAAAPWLCSSWYYKLTQAGIYALICIGLSLLLGYAGQISLGHAAFYAIGAYTSAILTAKAGWSPWLAIWVGVALSMIVALAGAVIVPVTGIQYDDGALLGLKGFCASVLGGLGNNPAAVVAGILLGILESLTSYVSSAYKDAMSLGILLVVLFIRPSGLFGKASLSRLSEF